MTKEQAIELIKEYKVAKVEFPNDLQKQALDMAIKALEQQPSDDVMAIHTQGLDEGIRCAMCTNSMRSDRGCDGGCLVNEDMYKKVMDTIKNQMFSRPTSKDCVSLGVYKQVVWERDTAIEQLKELGYELGEKIRTSEDCVSRAEMLKYQQYLHGKMSNEENHKLWEFIKALPPVTPTRKVGKWIKEEDTLGWDGHSYQCSVCGRSIHLDVEVEDLSDYPYCHCGVEMEIDEDGKWIDD